MTFFAQKNWIYFVQKLKKTGEKTKCQKTQKNHLRSNHPKSPLGGSRTSAPILISCSPQLRFSERRDMGRPISSEQPVSEPVFFPVLFFTVFSGFLHAFLFSVFSVLFYLSFAFSFFHRCKIFKKWPEFQILLKLLENLQILKFVHVFRNCSCFPKLRSYFPKQGQHNGKEYSPYIKKCLLCIKMFNV